MELDGRGQANFKNEVGGRNDDQRWAKLGRTDFSKLSKISVAIWPFFDGRFVLFYEIGRSANWVGEPNIQSWLTGFVNWRPGDILRIDSKN